MDESAADTDVEVDEEANDDVGFGGSCDDDEEEVDSIAPEMSEGFETARLIDGSGVSVENTLASTACPGAFRLTSRVVDIFTLPATLSPTLLTRAFFSDTLPEGVKASSLV